MNNTTSSSDLTEHYGRLAQQYDHRWRAYIRQTLEAALGALRLRGTEHILDAPCGTGEFMRMAIERFPNVSLTGIDIAPEMIEVARRKLTDCPRVRFQVADIEALPFVPETFDTVVCANVLHQLRHPLRALQECVRVLKPGGRLVVVAWCRDFWHGRLVHGWFRLFDRTYVGMHGLVQLTGMLHEVGLVVDRARRFVAKPYYGMMWCVAEKIVYAPS